MTSLCWTCGSSKRPQPARATLFALLALWAAYLLIAPTLGFGWLDSWHNEQRAVQLILLTATALVYAVMAFSRSNGPALGPPVWWYLFVVIGVISAAGSALPVAGFAEVGLFVSLSALVLLTARTAELQPVVVRRAARYVALLIAGSHVLAVAVRLFAAIHIGNPVALEVFMLGYANPRFGSALYAVLMPFVAYLIVHRDESTWVRISAAIVLALLWTINLGLGTRAIWFAYAVVCALCLAFGNRQTRRLVSAIFAAALAGLLIYLTLSLMPNGTGGSVDALTGVPAERLWSLTSREVLWELSWQSITQSPLLGIGPMAFGSLDSHVGAHPHNWVLQIGAEWGLPALSMLLFGLASAGRAAFAAARSDADYSAEAFLSVAVCLVYGLVDGNLVLPVSQTAAAITLGLALGSIHGSSHFAQQISKFAASAILTSISIVALYASERMLAQPEAIASFRKAHPGAWLTPRLWEQG